MTDQPKTTEQLIIDAGIQYGKEMSIIQVESCQAQIKYQTTVQNILLGITPPPPPNPYPNPQPIPPLPSPTPSPDMLV